ncbi:Putative amidase [Neorhizobium galegae bv. officinalis bv. officinalis str. HAMBI 1141]|uniref:Putative amidase n=1 Tax=Neorhizobium galegae bv. officinalis bv. officinalis str. HAMBI 1141 TaxID=1028801 RepID=A0A068TGJ5_NEOGA|nr:carbon-nitrogen hydrolase family protein [Neorhizobium galegae]CDN56575.1 Putative amidase [Neorhizobium galegae bv. officinalis bv. officinalis str. HAMBI 1141]
MTQNGNFKRRVRARAEKTGESYTAALSHIRDSAPSDPVPQARSVRLAVAQTTPYVDPRSVAELRASGEEMRRLMREAQKASARVIHFPEGATCSPNKRIMSSTGRDPVGPSDWSRFEWTVLREELDATRALARELGLFAVIGSVHQLTEPHRPHNSLYIVSDRGELVTRYDERLLSNTKISFMYTPGSTPVIFEVDGVRFGCSLGMETHFPEIFREYEQLDVDCVLFSTTGATPAFAAEALGHAASNRYWVSFSVLAYPGFMPPSGIASPSGEWVAQCRADAAPSLAIVDVDHNPGEIARPWRRTARAGIYEPHMVKDPRSGVRDTF